MLIDAHAHVFTKDVKNLLASMKENRIDKSVVIYWPQLKPVFGMYGPTLQQMVQIIKKHHHLALVGSLRVTKKTFSQDVQQLEETVKKKGIVGVKLYPGYEYFFANDSRCERIYRLCEKYRIPVIFHSGDVSGAKTAIVRFSDPLYIDDVAVKFPRLKIIIAHLGSPMWMKQAAEVMYKNENVYGEISAILPLSNRLSRHKGIENVELAKVKREVEWIAAYCGTPRKFIFGSDFPIYRQKHYIDFLDSIKAFSKEDKKYIQYKNARQLFRI